MKIIKAIVVLFIPLWLLGCSAVTDKNASLANVYSNPDLQFSVHLPNGWLQSSYTDYKDVPNSILGAIDMDFSNMPQPNGGFDITNMPENFEAIDLRVLVLDSKNPFDGKPMDYQQEFLPLLDYYERSTRPLQITKYTVRDNKDLILYVEDKEPIYVDSPNGKIVETPSEIRADAFYKGGKYAYWFSTSSAWNRDKESTKKLIESVLKPILSSFKDLS